MSRIGTDGRTVMWCSTCNEKRGQSISLLWFCPLQNTCFPILPHFLSNFLECFALYNLCPVHGELMITKPVLPVCRCLLKFHRSIFCTLLHRYSLKLLGCVLCSMWFATNGMVYLNGMCVLERELLCSPDLELLTWHPQIRQTDSDISQSTDNARLSITGQPDTSLYSTSSVC